jgi:hypothetical protein
MKLQIATIITALAVQACSTSKETYTETRTLIRWNSSRQRCASTGKPRTRVGKTPASECSSLRSNLQRNTPQPNQPITIVPDFAHEYAIR